MTYPGRKSSGTTSCIIRLLFDDVLSYIWEEEKNAVYTAQESQLKLNVRK